MSFSKFLFAVLGLSMVLGMSAEAKTKVTVDLNIGFPGNYYDPGYGGGYIDPGYPGYDYPPPPVVMWKCFAENRRGDIFPGRSRDQGRAMDKAISFCYDSGSRRCMPLWNECQLVRVRPGY